MKIFQRKINLQMIDTTSKMSLKLSSIAAAKGDVKRAAELYAFLSEGIAQLPDFTPTQPTIMQQITQTLKASLSFARDNRDDLLSAYQFLRDLRFGGGSNNATQQKSASVVLPELPNIDSDESIQS